MLDPRVLKALNELHKSQPALNITDLPSGQRGVLLGDIINDLYKQIAALTEKLDTDTGVADTDYVATAVAADDSPQLG